LLVNPVKKSPVFTILILSYHSLPIPLPSYKWTKRTCLPHSMSAIHNTSRPLLFLALRISWGTCSQPLWKVLSLPLSWSPECKGKRHNLKTILLLLKGCQNSSWPHISTFLHKDHPIPFQLTKFMNQVFFGQLQLIHL